ncbi:MAG: phosphate ABC transporter permease subunit PstC, partial [Trueperaceae bacterium]
RSVRADLPATGRRLGTPSRRSSLRSVIEVPPPTRDGVDEALARPMPSRFRRPGDRAFLVLVTGLALTVVALAVAMGWVLWAEGRTPIETFGFLGFLTGTAWNPVTGQFGTGPFLLGTLITSVAALALSFFPAVALAIYTAEYAPRWLAAFIDGTVDLLAAIPSVVLGIWGIFVLAPWLRDTFYLPVYLTFARPPEWAAPVVDQLPAGVLAVLGTPQNYNMVTFTLVLALMVVPFTTALARDALRSVPIEQREAMWALGATRWEVIRRTVVPYARGGIVAGAILAFGRAIGETMAAAMLIGNSNKLPFTLFGPAATMPSVIVNEFREAVENLHYSSLVAVGFYLFLLSLVINLGAAWLQRRLTVGSRGS